MAGATASAVRVTEIHSGLPADLFDGVPSTYGWTQRDADRLYLPPRTKARWLWRLAVVVVVLNGLVLVLTHHALRGENPLIRTLAAAIWLLVVIEFGYPAWIGARTLRRAT